MKKRSIIIGIILTLVVTAAVALRLLLPAQQLTADVRFNLHLPNMAVDIFKRSEQTTGTAAKVASITNNATVPLTHGDYYYLVSGENIAPESVNFTVTAAKTVEVTPVYTDAYLEFALQPELAAINDAIKRSYPLAGDKYTIHKGRLYQQGQWYATTLTDKRSTPKNPYDIYRIVLLKENGAWQPMTKPELVVSSIEYPGLPMAMLRTLNQLDPVLSPPPVGIIYD